MGPQYDSSRALPACPSSFITAISIAMSYLHLFETLIIVHIAFGAPGLISFWVPVATRKGSKPHKLWGKAFVIMMLVTASCAVGMASLTIADPVATHPKLV